MLAAGCATASLACQPGEPSTDCCIKKFPLSPMESCAASPSDVDRMLRLIAASLAVNEAAQTVNGVIEDDLVNDKDMPRWKQRCIDLYVACIDKKWLGSCYDCIRLCEGQQQWPQDKCRPRRKSE
jgi:hypothetical protein